MRPVRRRVRVRSTRILEPAGSVGSMDSPRTEMTTQSVGSMPWPSSQSRRNQTGPLTGASSRLTAPPPAAASISRVPTERAPGVTPSSLAAATGLASALAKPTAGGRPQLPRNRIAAGVRDQPHQRLHRALEAQQRHRLVGRGLRCVIPAGRRRFRQRPACRSTGRAVLVVLTIGTRAGGWADRKRQPEGGADLGRTVHRGRLLSRGIENPAQRPRPEPVGGFEAPRAHAGRRQGLAPRRGGFCSLGRVELGMCTI